MNLGQNFLISSGIINKIVDKLLSCSCAECVLEIGTGHGELTSELANAYRKVVSVEVDKQLYEYSVQRFKEVNNLDIVNYDFMRLDLLRFVNDKFGSSDVLVCANIPYYITSPIVMSLLESERFSFIVLMMQKEAAERIVCEPGVRNCGAISVAVRYYSRPKYVFDVSKNCFVPRPDVDSAVVTFETFRRTDVLNKKIFFKVVRSSFAKRRKNILNSISAGMCIKKDDLMCILDSLGIDKNSRAENLTFQNFVDISNLMHEKKL